MSVLMVHSTERQEIIGSVVPSCPTATDMIHVHVRFLPTDKTSMGSDFLAELMIDSTGAHRAPFE